MRKAFLAASALTLALSAGAWAQSTPPAATTGLHAPAPPGLVERTTRPGPSDVENAAGETTPSAGATGGPVVGRATGPAGVNAAAGASTAPTSGVNNAAGETTPSAGSTGAAVPSRTQVTGLPTVAAGLPQNQYVLQMGERMRQWFPVVDTYLDAGVAPEHAENQVDVKQAWERARSEWDELQSADASAWDVARSEFETAYMNFERAWNKAQRNS